MANNFPKPPIAVAIQLKTCTDQLQACKQWITASQRHYMTMVFLVQDGPLSAMNELKLQPSDLADLAPGTLQHLENFFHSLVDELITKKILLQQQHNKNELEKLSVVKKSFTKNFQTNGNNS